RGGEARPSRCSGRATMCTTQSFLNLTAAEEYRLVVDIEWGVDVGFESLPEFAARTGGFEQKVRSFVVQNILKVPAATVLGQHLRNVVRIRQQLGREDEAARISEDLDLWIGGVVQPPDQARAVIRRREYAQWPFSRQRILLDPINRCGGPIRIILDGH